MTARATAAFLYLLIGVGVARVVFTYPVFWQTADEPSHILGGLEWIERGSAWIEPKHPPLARVAAALGPYAIGTRMPQPDLGRRVDLGILLQQGVVALETGGHLEQTLAVARAGILPFFVLGCIAVWLLARRSFGTVPGLWAAGFASSSPIILAHAGVATTDMALAAMLTLALACFVAWLDRPSLLTSAGTGAIAALALLSKMSAAIYLPVAALVVLALHRWSTTHQPSSARRVGGLDAAVLIGTLGLVVWAGYQFSLGSVFDVAPALAEDRTTGLLARLGHLPVVPAPEWFAGFREMLRDNAGDRRGYLLGEMYLGGRALYFPIGFLVKTPLPLLLLEGWGLRLAIRQARATRELLPLAPAAVALAIFGLVIPSQINIGIRHILPVFLLLLPYAGLAAVDLIDRGRRWGRVALVLLAAWYGWSTIRIHPDYLAYFNEAASLSADPVVVDSDLDWGQDAKRLVRTVDELGIDSLYLIYLGSLDLQAKGLNHRGLPPPNTPVSGWIAISWGWLGLSDWYDWLRAYQPVRTVGKSILLYHIE